MNFSLVYLADIINTVAAKHLDLPGFRGERLL